MHPATDDSLLFHYPNLCLTKYLADAMQIPAIEFTINGSSKESEFDALEKAIIQAKSIYDIQGIVHGGISSKFQKVIFERICSKNQLVSVAPLWNVDPSQYMYKLVDNNFNIKIVGVSAMGLDQHWLGRSLDKILIGQLEYFSKKFGFNLTFEGGEAETLVVDCPIFSKRLDIRKANIRWDGQRGIFEILEVELISK
jgi:ABC transporter with metal-binding/Fe-S-binding domain ATP-binding protein